MSEIPRKTNTWLVQVAKSDHERYDTVLTTTRAHTAIMRYSSESVRPGGKKRLLRNGTVVLRSITSRPKPQRAEEGALF